MAGYAACKKCSVLVFPVNQKITMQLSLRHHIFKQVHPLKYLGVINDENDNWGPYIILWSFNLDAWFFLLCCHVV